MLRESLRGRGGFGCTDLRSRENPHVRNSTPEIELIVDRVKYGDHGPSEAVRRRTTRQCDYPPGRLVGAVGRVEIGRRPPIDNVCSLCCRMPLPWRPAFAARPAICCFARWERRMRMSKRARAIPISYRSHTIFGSSRNKTGMTTRPNRHLSYSHGKFCRGHHATTYDRQGAQV